MQDIVLKIRYFERELLRSLKKLNLFFLLNPLPFDGQDHKKKGGLKLVTSHSSGYKTSSEKKLD